MKTKNNAMFIFLSKNYWVQKLVYILLLHRSSILCNKGFLILSPDTSSEGGAFRDVVIVTKYLCVYIHLRLVGFPFSLNVM